jgi:hypothetical protein
LAEVVPTSSGTVMTTAAAAVTAKAIFTMWKFLLGA